MTCPASSLPSSSSDPFHHHHHYYCYSTAASSAAELWARNKSHFVHCHLHLKEIAAAARLGDNLPVGTGNIAVEEGWVEEMGRIAGG